MAWNSLVKSLLFLLFILPLNVKWLVHYIKMRFPVLVEGVDAEDNRPESHESPNDAEASS